MASTQLRSKFTAGPDLAQQRIHFGRKLRLRFRMIAGLPLFPDPGQRRTQTIRNVIAVFDRNGFAALAEQAKAAL